MELPLKPRENELSPQQSQDLQAQGQVPQQPVMQNPFDDATSLQGSAGGVMVPNLPMQESGSAMLKTLTETDTIIPQKFQEEFHWVFNKDVILTFLDEERKQRLMEGFKIMELNKLYNIPFYDYTYETEMNLSMAELMYEVRLNRALGFTKGNQVNERTAQQSQFSEARNVMNNESEVAPKPGFFGKFFSNIGKRG